MENKIGAAKILIFVLIVSLFGCSEKEYSIIRSANYPKHDYEKLARSHFELDDFKIKLLYEKNNYQAILLYEDLLGSLTCFRVETIHQRDRKGKYKLFYAVDKMNSYNTSTKLDSELS